jgi:predicted NBD/HSP70 family sugar kinase
MPHRGLSGTNLKYARDHNMRVTLQAVRLHGPVSRPELAQITGLTPQAIAYMCRELIDEGLVHETGRRRGGRGQPAAELAINPNGGYSLGINIDRDHLTVLLSDLSGKVRGRLHWEDNFMLPDDTFRRIERAHADLLADAGLVPDDLAGVGLAIPYKIGYQRSIITPRSYALWHDFPARERLQEITGRPVYQENDASAAAFAEIQYGLGIEYKNFFYIFIGIGLGGGLVVNGDYVPGANGHGGEVGFIPSINGSGRPEPSHNVQADVSLGALYARLSKTGTEVTNPDDLDALHTKKCKATAAWVEQAADSLLMTLLTVICVVNPEAILIGGRLPTSLIDDLIDASESRLLPFRNSLPSFPPMRRAACSPDAPAVGATILPFSELFFPRTDGILIRGESS